jgi:uncharacterized protein (TIGR02466 family)
MIYNILPTPIYITKLVNYPKSEMIAALEVLMKNQENEENPSSNFGDVYDIEQVHNLPEFKFLNEAIAAHAKQYLTCIEGNNNIDFNIYAQKSWSVHLVQGGEVCPHQHLNGAISSVFYISLPEGCNTGVTFSNVDGAINTLPLPSSTDPRMDQINIEEGMLVLFPSALHHGTNTINESVEPRISVSYDLTITTDHPFENATLDVDRWKRL